MAALNVLIRTQATADINEAAAFYGLKDEDGRLAARFLREMEETVTKVSVNPLAYPRVYRGFHRALIHHFPFGIYYLVHRDLIEIFAVLHGKRAKAILRRRASEG